MTTMIGEKPPPVMRAMTMTVITANSCSDGNYDDDDDHENNNNKRR